MSKRDSQKAAKEMRRESLLELQQNEALQVRVAFSHLTEEESSLLGTALSISGEPWILLTKTPAELKKTGMQVPPSHADADHHLLISPSLSGEEGLQELFLTLSKAPESVLGKASSLQVGLPARENQHSVFVQRAYLMKQALTRKILPFSRKGSCLVPTGLSFLNHKQNLPPEDPAHPGTIFFLSMEGSIDPLHAAQAARAQALFYFRWLSNAKNKLRSSFQDLPSMLAAANIHQEELIAVYESEGGVAGRNLDNAGLSCRVRFKTTTTLSEVAPPQPRLRKKEKGPVKE